MPDVKQLISFLTMPSPAPDTPQAYFMRMPRVETARLVLRRVTPRDAQDIYDYSRDEAVAQHVLWTAHRSIREARALVRFLIQQYRSGEPSSWCIEEKASGRVIGTIGFMGYQADNATVELGYSLARSRWNQGMMTEALAAVLAECFRVLKLHRVEAQHFSANPASGRVMAKCGMTHEGTLRRRIFNKGRFMDVEMWAILRADWEQAHPAP